MRVQQKELRLNTGWTNVQHREIWQLPDVTICARAHVSPDILTSFCQSPAQAANWYSTLNLPGGSKPSWQTGEKLSKWKTLATALVWVVLLVLESLMRCPASPLGCCALQYELGKEQKSVSFQCSKAKAWETRWLIYNMTRVILKPGCGWKSPGVQLGPQCVCYRRNAGSEWPTLQRHQWETANASKEALKRRKGLCIWFCWEMDRKLICIKSARVMFCPVHSFLQGETYWRRWSFF